MGIEDEKVICVICRKNKLFGEIGRAEVIQGVMTYYCKDCNELIKNFVENYPDTQIQREIDDQHSMVFKGL